MILNAVKEFLDVMGLINIESVILICELHQLGKLVLKHICSRRMQLPNFFEDEISHRFPVPVKALHSEHTLSLCMQLSI